MIGLVINLILITFWVGIVAACLAGAVWLWRDDFEVGGARVIQRSFAVACLLVGVFILLLPIGVATGEVDMEAVADGCYQVINDLEVMPAGRTFIVYNDRHYISIECPR